MFNFILFLVLLLPFQVALSPTEDIDLASIRIFIIALFFLWLLAGLKKKKIIIKKGFISVFILIFLFLNLLSSGLSENFDWSVRKLLFLFSVFPIYFVISSVVSTRKQMFKVVKFLIWSGTVSAAIGIIQFFLQFIIGLEKTYGFWARYLAVPFLGKAFSAVVLKNPSWLVNISGETYLRSTSLFPDPHMFSFFLGILAPLSLGIALKSKKILYFLAFFILLLGDTLTFSRGGYIGILAGFIAIFLVFWFKFSIKYKIAYFLAMILTISALFFPSPVSNRLFSSLNLKEGSNMGRFEMWKKAYTVAAENPFLGVGIGNYSLEIKPSAGYREPIYAHNTYLDIASETGILNAIVWTTMLLFAIILFIRKTSWEKFFLWPAISLIVFSVHSFFETAIYSPVVLTLLLIIISFANIDKKDEKNF